MKVRRTCTSALVPTCCLLISFGDVDLSIAESTSNRLDGAGTVFELFSALGRPEVDVRLIARDSKRATLQLANLTDQPLTIRLPEAAVALPVLAQPVPAARANAGQQAGQNQAPQALGIGFPRANGQNNFQNNLPGQNNFAPNNFQGQFNLQGQNNLPGQLFAPRDRRPRLPNGLFNVPAEKVIRIKLNCVCLEYGKPDPRPRIDYQLLPLESFTESAQLLELLRMLGQERSSQQVAQIAAWHLADSMSWEKLSQLRVTHANGLAERMFRPADLHQAQRLVGTIQSRIDRSRTGSKAERSASASRSQPEVPVSVL